MRKDPFVLGYKTYIIPTGLFVSYYVRMTLRYKTVRKRKFFYVCKTYLNANIYIFKDNLSLDHGCDRMHKKFTVNMRK